MGKRDYFRNGTIEMIALSLLNEADLYGYQLVQTIAERSGGVISIQIGSLYPVLYRLRDEGYISAKRKIVVGILAIALVLAAIVASLAAVTTHMRQDFYDGYYVETIDSIPENADPTPSALSLH